MPTASAGHLPYDASSLSFTGPWDPATNTGYGQRGANINTAGDGLADSRVVLYDNLGNPLITKTTQTVFASAARTSTVISAAIPTYNAKVAVVLLNVTVASGTGGLQVRYYWASVALAQLNALPTAVITTGPFVYVLGVEASTGTGIPVAVPQICNVPVPDSIEIQIVHGDASSYTYSVTLLLAS